MHYRCACCVCEYTLLTNHPIYGHQRCSHYLLKIRSLFSFVWCMGITTEMPSKERAHFEWKGTMVKRESIIVKYWVPIEHPRFKYKQHIVDEARVGFIFSSTKMNLNSVRYRNANLDYALKWSEIQPASCAFLCTNTHP